MDTNSKYRLLTSADVEEATQVISRAFQNDPLIEFMLPIKATHIKTLMKFFRVYGEIYIKSRRGYRAGEPLEDIAYWEFPDQAPLSISVKSLGKFIPLLFTMYPIGYFRARAVIAITDALHKKHASEPHYYLDNLGVLPSAQGKKYSSKLLRPILELADSQKVITCTDTVTRGNVPFYEHFGFQLAEESAIPSTGITVFALRRPVL